ncbi:MAG: lmo0937 family membrane protein [Bacteroidota bacterium]
MLYVVAVVLLILWLVGLLTSTMGGLIHILLVIAIIVVLLRVVRGRKAFGSKS